MTAKNKKKHDGDRFDEWWKERTIPVKIVIVIGFTVLGAGLLFLFGLVVQALWNWLMPEIFSGLKKITYWQAWGLLILSSILFKKVNFGNDHNKVERKRKRKLRNYMKEEMEKEADSFPEGPENPETAL